MLTNYFSQYGLIVFFIIIFLEYLNTPGLAAGIVMPLAGVWAANEGVGFFTAIFISVIAGLLRQFSSLFYRKNRGRNLFKEINKEVS